MKERPIIFNAEMVRAILADRKAQARRVMKPQPIGYDEEADVLVYPGKVYEDRKWREAHCPYGQAGDRLWVREAIRVHYIGSVEDGATYLADLTPVMGTGPRGSYRGRALVDWKWKGEVLPSIHMPRWASRITLEVTGVRVERVQDISEEDAWAEGLVPAYSLDHPELASPEQWTIRADFAALWDRINATRGYGWETNPWVWRLAFKVV